MTGKGMTGQMTGARKKMRAGRSDIGAMGRETGAGMARNAEKG